MASESRFWVLETDSEGPYSSGYLRIPAGQTGDDAPKCPQCGRAVGMLRWLPPCRVEIEVFGNAGPGDVLSDWEWLVSWRFADAFRAEGLTGLEGFHPVEVVKMNARARKAGLPGYLMVRAVHGHGAVDEGKSRLRRKRPVECAECRNTGLEGIYGFAIERGTWDGLDVFRPRGAQGNLVVSERFAERAAKHRFTNIKLTPTDRFTWDPLRMGPPPAVVPA